MPRIAVAIVLGILSGARGAEATCGWFGTQLECAFGAGDVVIGTQLAGDPEYPRCFRPQPFHGEGRLVDDRPAAADAPFLPELQDIGRDPTLCRRIGNESYCY